MHETVSANPVQYLGYEKENFKHNTNPNHPGPCVCKYATNIGAHLQGFEVFHLYRN